MELVGNPASGSLDGSLNGAYYIASFMPHIIKQASTTHNFQLFDVMLCEEYHEHWAMPIDESRTPAVLAVRGLAASVYLPN